MSSVAIKNQHCPAESAFPGSVRIVVSKLLSVYVQEYFYHDGPLPSLADVKFGLSRVTYSLTG